MPDDATVLDLRATVAALEDENAQLRAAILSVNERLAELIVLDETLAGIVGRLENEL
jgi:hypothetical protein